MDSALVRDWIAGRMLMGPLHMRGMVGSRIMGRSLLCSGLMLRVRCVSDCGMLRTLLLLREKLDEPYDDENRAHKDEDRHLLYACAIDAYEDGHQHDSRTYDHVDIRRNTERIQLSTSLLSSIISASLLRGAYDFFA